MLRLRSGAIRVGVYPESLAGVVWEKSCGPIQIAFDARIAHASCPIFRASSATTFASTSDRSVMVIPPGVT